MTHHQGLAATNVFAKVRTPRPAGRRARLALQAQVEKAGLKLKVKVEAA